MDDCECHTVASVNYDAQHTVVEFLSAVKCPSLSAPFECKVHCTLFLTVSCASSSSSSSSSVCTVHTTLPLGFHCFTVDLYYLNHLSVSRCFISGPM